MDTNHYFHSTFIFSHKKFQFAKYINFKYTFSFTFIINNLMSVNLVVKVLLFIMKFFCQLTITTYINELVRIINLAHHIIIFFIIKIINNNYLYNWQQKNKYIKLQYILFFLLLHDNKILMSNLKMLHYFIVSSTKR